jgi:hypothetical protein
MKKIVGLIILTLAIASIPVLLFFNYSCFMKIASLSKDDAFRFITSIFPLIFSIVILLMNSIIGISKDIKLKKEMDLSLVNKNTEKYNIIMIKLINRYNSLMNDYIYFDKTISLLTRVKEFEIIFSNWKNEMPKHMDYSNDSNLRDHIRTQIWTLIDNYKKDELYLANLEVLKNMTFEYEEKSTLDNTDEVFVYNMRNYICISTMDKQIFGTYSGFLDGKYDKRLINAFNVNLTDYKLYFENSVQTKSVDPTRFHSAIYGVILGILSVMEYLIKDMQLISIYQEKLFENYKNYHFGKIKLLGALDEFVHIITVKENDKIDKYMSRELLFEYYQISNQA